MARGKIGGNFFAFFAKGWGSSYRNTGMGKNTISTGFIVLACVDVVALSQLSLSLGEAVAFGALCVTSYGLGIWSGLAE